ncbi:MAG: GAF domain-containing protein [Anaerolineae bacterium]|nr:GAF domain-containing protein [Anaerolineae bacterium]
MFESDGRQQVINQNLQTLRESLSNVVDALREQQSMLRLRNISLPQSIIQNLDSVLAEFNWLQTRVGEDAHELDQLRSVAATTATINSSLDLDAVLRRSMDEVLKLTRADQGYIVLQDQTSGELEFRIASGANGANEFQGSRSILITVINSGKPLLTHDALDDPRVGGSMTIAHKMLRSVLCVPLTYRDQVMGALYLDSRHASGIFGDREQTLLMAFANQTAVAIENARLFQRVQQSLAETIQLNELKENVFESIASGVITAGAEQIITVFNRAASEILAQPSEAALGQPLADILPISPEVLEESLQIVRQQSLPYDHQAAVNLPARGERILNLSFSPLQDASGITMVVDDLTEHEAREERLMTLRRYLPGKLVDDILDIDRLSMGGERREVTCLFVDVRSFAQFPPDLRPRQVMNLLNQYLTVATECIHRHGGIIDKYMGTEVMALFNTRLNEQPDHALRALNAGLDMREAYLQLYAQEGVQPDPHYYRVGIHSGVATIGNVGSETRRDFTALGDTINLAHRLLENANGGEIIMSQDAWAYVIGVHHGHKPTTYELRPHEPIKAKGRQQMTTVYDMYRK